MDKFYNVFQHHTQVLFKGLTMSDEKNEKAVTHIMYSNTKRKLYLSLNNVTECGAMKKSNIQKEMSILKAQLLTS